MAKSQGHLGLQATAALLFLLCCGHAVAARPAHMRRSHERKGAQHAKPSAAAGPGRQLTQEVVTTDPFVAAPSCRALPTANTTTRDDVGRLWGWRNNASCAYKDVAGRVLFYTDYSPGDWLHTPACSMPAFPENSVADSRFKVWAWEESGSLCAFKDDQQQPIPIQKKFTRLSWQEAAACIMEPVPNVNNSMPDGVGCLWGWQLDRNCAFKSGDPPQPVYYEGYGRVCNITANVMRASEFNEQAANGNDAFRAVDDGVLPLPGTNAPIPVVGQKRMQEEYTDDAASNLFHNDGGNTSTPSPTPSEGQPQPPSPAPAADLQPPSPAPAAVVTVPAAPGSDSQSPSRRLQQTDNSDVADPRFPKKAQQAAASSFARGWTDGGPGGVSPPRHGSRSLTKLTPLLPESKTTEFSAAEGDEEVVIHKDVPQSTIPEAADCGLGAFTPPGTSAKGPIACVRDVTSGDSAGASATFQVSEAGAQEDAAAGILPLGHAVDVNGAGAGAPSEFRRKVLASAFASAVSMGTASSASAVATSTGGNSVATAVSDKGGKADAVSNANAADGSTAVAISNANATNGGTAAATSKAEATDGRNTTVVVDAQGHGPNKSCILSVSAVNGKFTWRCSEADGSAPGNAAPGSSPSLSNAAPDSSPAAASPAVAAPGDSSDAAAANANADAAPSGGSVSYDVLAPSWQEALACREQPNKTNSVQDSMGRLWGFDAGLQRPCAFRKLDGTTMEYADYIQIKWETAPPCTDTPTSANSMPDAQGRLWGWLDAEQENCAFKDPSSGKPIYYPGFKAVPVPQPQEGVGMLPSAAGPANNNTTNTTNTTTTAPRTPTTAEAAADEAALTKEAVAQTDEIKTALSPNATIAAKANAAARAALTVMVASDALHAASSNVPAGVMRASEGEDTQPLPPAPLATARWYGIIRAVLARAAETR